MAEERVETTEPTDPAAAESGRGTVQDAIELVASAILVAGVWLYDYRAAMITAGAVVLGVSLWARTRGQNDRTTARSIRGNAVHGKPKHADR